MKAAPGKTFQRSLKICSIISFTFWLHLQCCQITLAVATAKCTEGQHQPHLNLVNFQSEIVENGKVFIFMNSLTNILYF